MSENDLQKELAYYKKQLDRSSGESIRNDFILSSVRHQLKQKKEAIDTLTILQKEFSTALSLDSVFAKTVKAINKHLRMDRSIVLFPGVVSNIFTAGVWYGYPDESLALLEKGEIELLPDIFKSGQYLLLNKSMKADELCQNIQKTFVLNYFTGVPVLADEEAIAFIIVGREFEKVPFILPLDKGDADTLQAIAGLVSTIIQNRKMVELKLQKTEVEKQKEAISVQRDTLSETLAELRHTQAQLIQKEKMASLGELTAGIAHEIQNPLNFVNNFSEINTELISELQEERKKEIRDLINEDDIIKDIKVNEQKINYHGKRADAIVKGMLQHSQRSNGLKEAANINKLADEYLRLAYHGIRAKDNTFNARLICNFDEGVNLVNIIPQDIGRVLLNLYNNAFYAVGEKIKKHHDGYEPTVSVSTKRVSDTITINVKDNGNGMPKQVIDKIFQPFFTTKPTGQGTGLGLSLSYDIVKAHGGEIKLETKEGIGSEFIIILPT